MVEAGATCRLSHGNGQKSFKRVPFFKYGPQIRNEI